VDDDEDDVEAVAVCTKNNQHLVIGPLSMLHSVWQDATVRISRREPEVAKALMLMCMSIIRYDPMVRPACSRTNSIPAGYC
jgi:hypothetical protein